MRKLEQWLNANDGRIINAILVVCVFMLLVCYTLMVEPSLARMLMTVGGSAPAAGDACSSCTPGEPTDVLCEDFEDSDGWWCTWTDSLTGSATTGTQAPTAFACTYAGAKSRIYSIDSGDTGYSYDTGYSNNNSYVRFYFTVTEANLDGSEKVTLFQIYESGWDMILSFRIVRHAASATWTGELVFEDAGGTDRTSTGSTYLIDDGEDIEIKISFVGNTSISVTYDDGTTDETLTDGAETVTADDAAIYGLGPSVVVNFAASDAVVAEFELLAIDDDTIPDSCIGW
jgi:hypothetical protein